MSQSTILISALAAIPISFVLYGLFLSDGLRSIPAVGPTDPIRSYINAFRFVRHAKEILQEGYNKYKGRVFRVPMLDQWLVVVSSPKLIEELRKMPDDEMSLPRGLGELVAAGHLFGENMLQDPYHIPVIHKHLSRNLPGITTNVDEEIVMAFQELVPAKGDQWIGIHALKTMIDIIARSSNRVFIDLPLCRDRGFLELSTTFTMDVSKARFLINLFPPFLKPVVARVVSSIPNSVKRGMEFLKPIIEERQRQWEQYGEEWSDKPNDMLMWLMDEVRPKGYSLENIVLMFLIVEFTAIHTTAMSFTHALFHLAANPKLAIPLRDEVESVLREDGELNKAAMTKLRKIDSFLRESQRLNGVNAISLFRKSLKDVTFSDGTRIPAGTFVVAAATGTHMDEDVYTEPELFQPWRFVDKEAKGAQPQSFVSTSVDYIPFGHGKHACPGRFFAAYELKRMMAYILINYDVKFINEGIRPDNKWFGATIIPDPAAQVLFRKRRTDQ